MQPVHVLQFERCIPAECSKTPWLVRLLLSPCLGKRLDRDKIAPLSPSVADAAAGLIVEEEKDG